MEMITTIITTTRLMVVMMVVMEQRRRWRWWPDCTFWGNCPSWSGEQWEIWCGKSVPIPRKIWTALRWQNCLIYSFIVGPIQCSWKKASVEYQSVAIVKLVAWSNVGKLSTQSSLSLCHLITLWKVEIKQWALERNSKEGLHLKWFQHPVE